jgi:hypothetical protein
MAFIAMAMALPSLLAPISTYDGGLAPSSATFILHGDLPYRDFWWLYGPGSPAIVAVFTAIFGPSLLLLRLIGVGFLGLQAGMGYLLLRTRLSHVPAAVIALASGHAPVVLLGLDPSAWSVSMSLAIAGLAIRVALPHRSFLAGLVLGFALLARFDVGVYALLAALVSPNRRPLIAGFACVATPLAAILLILAPVGNLWEQVVWYPLVGPRQFRGLPSPNIDDWIVLLINLPLLVIPRLAILAAAVRLSLARDRPAAFSSLLVFAALCQLQTQGRSDIFHYAQAATPGLLLLGLWIMKTPMPEWHGIVEWLLDRVPPRSRRVIAVVFVGAACASAFATGSLSLAVMSVGSLGSGDEGFVAGVRTIDANSSRDDRIFVGLTSHRYTVVNPMLAYYLADRSSAVRVAMFNPGVTNTEPVQREMVANLKAANAQIMLLDDRFADSFEASNDSRIPGSEVLDDYIALEYEEVCRFGGTRIFAIHARAPSIKCVQPTNERLIDILGGLR